MAVLTTIPYAYRTGAGALGYCVGNESGAGRVSMMRYKFTAPPEGATKISWVSNDCSLTEYYYGTPGFAWGYVGSVNWIISTDPDSYIGYLGDDGYNATAKGGESFSGSVNINLMPNQDYYLFLYPDRNFGGMYAIFSAGTVVITTEGAYGISSLLATNANIGSASALTINSYSNAFTHTIQYKIAGQSDYTTIYTKTSEISFSWTVPMATYDYMSPTEKQKEIEFKCITYSGSITVGESTTTIQAYAVESECKPTVSAAFTLLNDASALTGNNTTAILNWSNVRITVSATGKHGATISKYTIIHNGNTYDSNTHDFTKIQVASFTYRATDTRGYVSEGSLVLTAIPYLVPTITITTTPPNIQTGETKTTASGKVFTGSFGAQNNSITVQYRYKISGGNYGDWITLTHSTNQNNYTTAVNSITLDYHQKYVFQGRIVDSLNTILSTEIPVVALPVYDWGKDDFQFNVVVCLSDDSYGSTLPQYGKEGQIFLKI